MIRILRSFIALSLLISSFAYATTYTYTGNNFTVVAGAYTTSMKVTGSLTTSSPIPPDSIDFDISTILTAWSFHDGVQTIDSTVGMLHPDIPPLFSTDSTGNVISVIQIVFYAPIASVVGERIDYIYVTPTSDLAVSNGECFEVTDGVCSNGGPVNDSGQNDTTGVWVTTHNSIPVPTMSQLSLMLLTLMLGMVGFARLRFNARP